jgi:hypothetical protein
VRNFLQVCSGVNVIPLLQQIYTNEHLWSKDQIRQDYSKDSPHKDVQDILIRFSDTSDKGIGDVIQCEWLAASILLPAAKSLALSVMGLMQGEQLGRVMITRLPPGKSIVPHADTKGKYANFYTRYHIPLVSDPGVSFNCGGESLNMTPGGIWWFNGHREHSVVNNSASDRINLIVDCRVNG